MRSGPMERALTALLLVVGGIVVGGIVVSGIVVGAPLAAADAASGSWLAPVRDRYETGDVATLVAYVGAGPLGWVGDGPFYGYLHPADAAPASPSERGEPLGRISILETWTEGWTALRVSIEVRLAGLAPGHYQVGYCNDPCRNGLGDLLGSRAINVGVDPVGPLVREWPLDEPLIDILAPGALVSGPGYLAPAADIWAGRVVPAPEPAPEPVPAVPPAPAVSPPLPAPVAPQPPSTSPVTLPPGPEQPVPGIGVGADRGSPALVWCGLVLAAACTGGVLWALRQEGRVPVPV